MVEKAASPSKEGFFSRLNPFPKKSYGPSVPSNIWHTISEAFTGAWQRNIEWKRETVLAQHAVFSCQTLIASDISKLMIRMVRLDKDIWVDIPFDGFEVLKRPNTYQNRIQFIENWVLSKLSRGNTYVLKQRDNKGKVIRLHVLNPDCVLPLVSNDGQVFYQLAHDNLSGIQGESTTVPASEIIHDRFNCLFHPLVGLSPLFACGLAAFAGLKIQENSAKLFRNMSRPSGILTAPAAISDVVAKRLKEDWEANFSGENYGKTAILGDGLTYQPMYVNAVDSQMVEQLKLNAEIVCSTFHVPAYKVIGNAPAYNNVEAMESSYYSQCLQILIESIELCLDEGLDMKEGVGTEFDLDGLLRMDTKSQVETLGMGVIKALYAPNEARRKLNLPAVKGGDTPFLQQQNWPIDMLSERSPDDLNGKSPAPARDEPQKDDEEKQALKLALLLRKELSEVEYNV